jgi:hypothetical protein
LRWLTRTSPLGITAVLANFFGPGNSFTVDSSNSAAGTRFFPDFPAALDELVAARIFGGIHFRSADVDARQLGNSIGNYVIANSFQPLNGHHSGQIRK